MTKNRNKILVAIIAVLVALCCAFGVSLAYFTDSASIHAGIKTTKLTGEIGQTIALGTPQSDEIWRESLGTVKDGDSTLYEALDTDIKDGTATKADIKTVTVSRGNALAVNDDGSMNQNQFFKTSFKNNGSVDEVIYPEIRLTGLNGENLSQYKDILGIAEPDTSGTLSKALAFQNVIDGTAENLLHGKSWNVDSTATKVVANDDGSLSLYLPGIALKPGESVEKTYTITENMVGHTDYSCPTVAVTVNATIRYSNVGNAMWYGIVTSDVADSTVKYTLAPDIQTRVLWQSVTGKYTVRGGQDAFLVYDKDNAEALSALDYSVAKYQYSGKDMTPTAYLFGDKVDVKVYKLTNGAWGPAENNAAVERGSYKAVADTTNTDGFAVSHTEFYFDVVKATSNVSFDNKVGEDGKPNPDNKLTWTGDTADKEYDGKQVDIVGKDKDGNTITDFIYTNKDTGESSEIPPKDAGTYEVKPKGDDNHDYTNTATITIRKKTLQVTPTVSKNPLLPTDKPGFGYTVSGFVEGDNELDINGKKVQYIVDGVEAPSSGKSYAVGDHTLTCSGLTAKNYDFVYGITSFAVGKGTTTVNFENKPGTDGKDDPNNHLTWANANSATKVYDGVALSVQARDSDGSVVEVEYYTSDGKTKLDAAPKNVGIYVVKACDSENYTYSNSGTITISKATVHVTPVLDKTEMNYTDMVPANITYDIQGIVAGDEKYFDESAIGYIPYYEPSNTEYAAGMYNWTQKTTFRPTDYSYAGKYTLDACCEWHTDSYYCKSDNYMLDWGSATIQVNPIKLTPGTEDSNVTIKGDISSFNTSSVVYMQQMFFGCTSLPELNVTSFNTSNVKNMGEMFSNCIKLTKLDLSSFDTAKVDNMQQMFYKDYNLKTIYASDKFVTTVAWKSKQMFDGCTALVGGNGTVYDSKNVGSGYAHIDAADNPGYFTSITARNSAEDETKPVVVNTDEVVDAAPTPEPEVEETVEPAESETTGSPAESSAESTAESESEESTTDETVTE